MGRSLGLYNVFVGGSFEGTRLARLYRPDVRSADLVNVLAETLDQWRARRAPGEAFGDWAARELVPESSAPPDVVAAGAAAAAEVAVS